MGTPMGWGEPRWQVKQVTSTSFLKWFLLRASSISIIFRAVCFSFLSSLSIACSTWQNSQSTPRAPPMNCMVGMSWSAGISFRAWMFLYSWTAVLGTLGVSWARVERRKVARKLKTNNKVILAIGQRLDGHGGLAAAGGDEAAAVAEEKILYVVGAMVGVDDRSFRIGPHAAGAKQVHRELLFLNWGGPLGFGAGRVEDFQSAVF